MAVFTIVERRLPGQKWEYMGRLTADELRVFAGYEWSTPGPDPHEYRFREDSPVNDDKKPPREQLPSTGQMKTWDEILDSAGD